MSLEIQFVHMQSNDQLKELVQQKVDKLKSKYSWITNVAVFLKKENHNSDRDKVCEIRLSVPGPQLFASTVDDTFEKAINRTIEELGIQLEKKKEILYNS